jgi:RND family efflux transporter MFP subunit
MIIYVPSLLWLLGEGCREKNVPQPPPPPVVTVNQPVRQDVTEYLDLTGNTQAINTVQLRARVEGYLEKVLYQDGDHVKKGQLLYQIQRNTYNAKLQQAQANVQAQQATLDHATTEYNRYSNLLKQNAASQTDVDQWRFQRDSAQASLLSAKGALQLAQLDLNYTQVISPFDGRIDMNLVDAGNLVGAGQNTVLATVNQIDPIYVYFTINERDLLHMIGQTKLSPAQIGQQNRPAYFALADEVGYPHRGVLDFTSITVTSTTGTLLMRGTFPNPDEKILPGLFARVRMPIGIKKSAVLVPQVAIGFDQQGDYVLLVNDRNIVERRSVVPGIVSGTNRVIDQGLQGNEQVVVDGLLRAIPGREVTPMKETANRPNTWTSQSSQPGRTDR